MDETHTPTYCGTISTRYLRMKLMETDRSFAQQPVVATSLTETEFYATVTCTKGAKYLRSVLQQLEVICPGAIHLLLDNQAAIAMVNENPPTPCALLCYSRMGRQGKHCVVSLSWQYPKWPVVWRHGRWDGLGPTQISSSSTFVGLPFHDHRHIMPRITISCESGSNSCCNAHKGFIARSLFL